MLPSPEHFAVLDWHHLLPFVFGFQIGPRIRVGGTLGKIGQGLKTGVGKVAQMGGHVVSLFNPALGAAISTAGDVLDTTDGRFNVGRAAMNAATQYGTGKLLSGAEKYVPGVSAAKNRLLQVPGVQAVGDAIGSARQKLSGIPGASQVGAEVGRAARRVAGGHSPIAGLGASDVTGGGDDGMSAMDKILLGGAVAAGTESEMRRRKLQDRAIGAAEGAYNARAPLRDRAMKLLQNEEAPDYSDMFADPGNIYATSRRPAAGGV